MRCEITVRNVVFGGIAARPEGSPHHGSAGRLAPPLLAPPNGRNKRGPPGMAGFVAVMEAGRHGDFTLFS